MESKYRINNCPTCRRLITNDCFSTNYFLKNLIERESQEPQLKSYYDNLKTINIISYYARKKEYECPICMNIMFHPINLSCGHTICNKCSNYIEIDKQFQFKYWKDELVASQRENSRLMQLNFNLDVDKRKTLERSETLKIRYNRLEKEVELLKKKNKEVKESNEFYCDRLKNEFNKHKRKKICFFWLQGKCVHTDEECNYAHGETMLNTYY